MAELKVFPTTGGHKVVQANVIQTEQYNEFTLKGKFIPLMFVIQAPL